MPETGLAPVPLSERGFKLVSAVFIRAPQSSKCALICGFLFCRDDWYRSVAARVGKACAHFVYTSRVPGSASEPIDNR